MNELAAVISAVMGLTTAYLVWANNQLRQACKAYREALAMKDINIRLLGGEITPQEAILAIDHIGK